MLQHIKKIILLQFSLGLICVGLNVLLQGNTAAAYAGLACLAAIIPSLLSMRIAYNPLAKRSANLTLWFVLGAELLKVVLSLAFLTLLFKAAPHYALTILIAFMSIWLAYALLWIFKLKD